MVIDRHVLTLDIAGFPESVAERGCSRCESRCRPGVEEPDHRHRRLLRARRERPRSRAAEQRDERAPFDHSITSSAVICMINGTVRPSALAVLRLITSSNLVGCKTGRSAGFVPLRVWMV